MSHTEFVAFDSRLGGVAIGKFGGNAGAITMSSRFQNSYLASRAPRTETGNQSFEPAILFRAVISPLVTPAKGKYSG